MTAGPVDRAGPGTAAPASAVRTEQVALVVNPVKAGDADALAAAIAERCVALGLAPPLVLPTTEEDPGQGPARQALRDGARLVIAAGGDGTVRAVAEVLAGSGVPLGVVPLGTGNLLARNLGLPIDPEAAIATALSGTERTIDVGRLEDGTVFTIMTGAGFDAAMMREAPEGLKAAVGWPAYIVGGIRSLRRDRVEARLVLDGGEPVRARLRTVIIGNLGRLQGGLELLPGATPDDGLLDVAVVCPRRLRDWAVLLGRALARRPRSDHRMSTYRARRVEVRLSRPQPRQVDGDLISSGTLLTATAEPGALVVRVPTGGQPGEGAR